MNEYDQLLALATALHKSRLWKTGSVEQALAVILMGRELGIGPTTALSNIIISTGKPTLGAALVGALIQKSGRYGYTVTEMTDQKVSVAFYENAGVSAPGAPSAGRTPLGVSTFTLQDALKARLGNSPTWQQYPRNLLLARAITNGARWYCPEVFGGAVYDPEEVAPFGGTLPAPVPDEEWQSRADEPTPATFTPSSSAVASNGVTLEMLLETFTAEQILSANGGNLPATDDELREVGRKLTGDAEPEPAAVG